MRSSSPFSDLMNCVDNLKDDLATDTGTSNPWPEQPESQLFQPAWMDANAAPFNVNLLNNDVPIDHFTETTNGSTGGGGGRGGTTFRDLDAYLGQQPRHLIPDNFPQMQKFFDDCTLHMKKPNFPEQPAQQVPAPLRPLSDASSTSGILHAETPTTTSTPNSYLNSASDDSGIGESPFKSPPKGFPLKRTDSFDRQFLRVKHEDPPAEYKEDDEDSSDDDIDVDGFLDAKDDPLDANSQMHLGQPLQEERVTSTAPTNTWMNAPRVASQLIPSSNAAMPNWPRSALNMTTPPATDPMIPPMLSPFVPFGMHMSPRLVPEHPVAHPSVVQYAPPRPMPPVDQMPPWAVPNQSQLMSDREFMMLVAQARAAESHSQTHANRANFGPHPGAQPRMFGGGITMEILQQRAQAQAQAQAYVHMQQQQYQMRQQMAPPLGRPPQVATQRPMYTRPPPAILTRSHHKMRTPRVEGSPGPDMVPGGVRKEKKKETTERIRFTATQKDLLETVLYELNGPLGDEKQIMMDKLGITADQLRNWYTNAKYKRGKKVTDKSVFVTPYGDKERKYILKLIMDGHRENELQERKAKMLWNTHEEQRMMAPVHLFSPGAPAPLQRQMSTESQDSLRGLVIDEDDSD